MKSGSPGVIFQFVQHMHARAWCLYTTYVTDKNGHHPVNFTGCSVRCSILASSIRILQFYNHPRKQTCSAPFYPKEQCKIQHARVQSFFWEGGGGSDAYFLVTFHDWIWIFPTGVGVGVRTLCSLDHYRRLSIFLSNPPFFNY